MTKSVSISENRCTGCGLCVKDCPQGELSIVSGKAVAAGEHCLRCGHCGAVCPQDAVSLLYSKEAPVPISSQAGLDPTLLKNVLYRRRSIRSFKTTPVPEEVVSAILDAGRITHTGRNRQKLTFAVLRDSKAEAEAIGVDFFRTVKRLGSPFSAYLRRKTIPDDFFFFGAPLVISVYGMSEADCVFAAANMEYMAEAYGLGVLVSGFFSFAVTHSRKLRGFLQLPDSHGKATTLVIGYPNVKYFRTAPRDPLDARYL